jgi:hypothetical protein
MSNTVRCYIPNVRATERSYPAPFVYATRAVQMVLRRDKHSVRRCSGIARANDLDVQVFRFTLGIPGFDDANIPRVIGAVGAVLLTLNHVLTAQPVPETQV